MKPHSLLCALGVLCGLGHAAEPAKPNVVFILADDLGWNDISLYGSTFHQTPHIDALAKRGMKFNNAYAASPLCSPTRASILSGLNPARIGITHPACHDPEEVLEKSLAKQAEPSLKALPAQTLTRFKTDYYTLGEAFKDNGYVTAHFGKWHLGPEPYSPLQHGFDTDIPHTPAPSPLGNGYFHPFPVWKNHGKPGDHLEDKLADEAAKFITRHKDQPFFLNYWAFEAHGPFQAKKEQIDRYRAKASPESLQRNPVYAGMVETLDDAVGRIVAALEQAGVLDNTIIVFTSDNGTVRFANNKYIAAEFHNLPLTSPHPLRGGKHNTYEAGTRVPLVVVWPGKVKPASESDALFQSTDFFPTFADLLGWKLPDDRHFDGVSQRPVLEKNTSVRTEVFCHFPHTQLYYEGPTPGPAFLSPASYLRSGDWKLIRLYCDNADQSDRHELYDLANDPGEQTDLASSHPERVKELSARLDAHLKDTGAVIPKPNPAYNPKSGKKPKRAKPPAAKP